MIDSSTDILPWLVDRRSRESKWNVCHRNGRSEGAEKTPLPFDKLYAAGYVLSWGDSLWYYPPLQLYGHPFTMAGKVVIVMLYLSKVETSHLINRHLNSF